MKGQGASHPGKRYDSEFKRESVRLADTSGKTDRQIERDLGLYGIGRSSNATQITPTFSTNLPRRRPSDNSFSVGIGNRTTESARKAKNSRRRRTVPLRRWPQKDS